MWRIASVYVVAYATLFSLALLAEVFFPRSVKLHNQLKEYHYWWVGVVMHPFALGVSFPVYIVARIFILLEAFLTLRNLPESATYTIQWTTFLPHI